MKAYKREYSGHASIWLESIAASGARYTERMDAREARELAENLIELCDELEGRTWAPGGGDVYEQIVDSEHCWYPMTELPTQKGWYLVTTERVGTGTRTIGVASFGLCYWSVFGGEMTPDGKSAGERIIKWAFLPRPAKGPAK